MGHIVDAVDADITEECFRANVNPLTKEFRTKESERLVTKR